MTWTVLAKYGDATETISSGHATFADATKALDRVWQERWYGNPVARDTSRLNGCEGLLVINEDECEEDDNE